MLWYYVNRRVLRQTLWGVEGAQIDTDRIVTNTGSCLCEMRRQQVVLCSTGRTIVFPRGAPLEVVAALSTPNWYMGKIIQPPF